MRRADHPPLLVSGAQHDERSSTPVGPVVDLADDAGELPGGEAGRAGHLCVEQVAVTDSLAWATVRTTSGRLVERFEEPEQLVARPG